MSIATLSTMSKEVQVLEFVTSFHTGGTERQFVNLVKGLEGSRFRTHVACFEAAGELRGELAGMPLLEIAIPSMYSLAAVRAVVSLARYLREHRIDIVHTTGLYPNVLGVAAARLARTPVIITSVRDMGHTWSPWQLRAQRLACRLAHVVVTNARAIATELRKQGYDFARIEVIPNGISAVPGAPPGLSSPACGALAGQGEPGRLRGEMGISRETPLVGVLSRIDRVKGLESFLAAAARVAPLHPGARFVVIGGPNLRVREDYLQELRDRAAALGLTDRVVFTGLRSDARTILHELTVSVQCSLSEGLSNSLLESMAAGLPVVATAVGGNPELVVDGETGILVPAEDPEALANAIARLLAEPQVAARMGRAGRRRVEAEYTCGKMTERMKGLYERLVDGRRRTAGALPGSMEARGAPAS